MHREHEPSGPVFESPTPEVVFTDPIKSFLFSSLGELEHSLIHLSDDDAPIDRMESLRMVKHIRKEMSEHPHTYVVADELTELSYTLAYAPQLETFENRITMYWMYMQELARSYGSTENRFCRLATYMTYEELTTFSDHLADFFNVGDAVESQKRKVFLRCFFLNDSSELDTSGPTQKKIQETYTEYFNHPLFSFLIPIFLRLQPHFAYELALIINVQKDPEIRKQVFQELCPVEIPWQEEVAVNNGSWFLCEASEDALMDTLSEQGYLVLVDAQKEPIVLVKFKGKESGLVLKSFVTQTGQIIPAGLWISPVSLHTRARLERVFDYKYQKKNIRLFGGQWAYMRNVNLDLLVHDTTQMTLSDLSALLSRRAEFIGQNPGCSQERKEYRKEVYEVD